MVRTASRLPSGQRPSSGLTKDEVTRLQRHRMLSAMAEVVSEQGYATVSVTDVIRRAGVSRATFYEQFANKQDCFLAAFDQAVDLLLGALRPVAAQGRDPQAFPRLLKRYLETLADNEAFALVFLVDIYAAGPPGFERRAASQQRIVDHLAVLFGIHTEEGRFTCEALVAAISSMVTTRVAARDMDGLRALHHPLTALAQTLLA